MTTQMLDPVDSARFRQVVGNFPTGVAVISAIHQGQPVGMTVASFTSVSLNPMLVGFFPDRSSTTWPKIRSSWNFCANVLADDQEPTGRIFASKAEDRFAGVAWHPAPSGSPILEGAAAWIDCTLYDILDTGDHWLAMGRVLAAGAAGEARPLVFWRSGYARPVAL
jgi:flavin reductase (DIM6/NTAB) family NADH-FMN oxidoreductase RutF